MNTSRFNLNKQTNNSNYVTCICQAQLTITERKLFTWVVCHSRPCQIHGVNCDDGSLEQARSWLSWNKMELNSNKCRGSNIKNILSVNAVHWQKFLPPMYIFRESDLCLRLLSLSLQCVTSGTLPLERWSYGYSSKRS